MSNSLWGDSFNVVTPNPKEILEKAKPKKVSSKKSNTKMSIEDKLISIENEVNRILGGYKNETLVIKTYEDFINYIDTSISNGIIAIDTETNNSLDPLTCKLMGLCLYTPNMKNAYIPVNHVDINTKERYSWQVTEEQIQEQLNRLTNTQIIMHNGKFDYQVIKCTCDCTLHIDWDTLIGAKVLDENERAGLKQQYIEKIDSSIEKYSIEALFEGLEYAIIEPELFALYAATDSFMTYELYKLQKSIFEQSDNSQLYSLFKNIEMPVVIVTAEMELTGICIDTEYAKRLSDKYHKKLEELDKKIETELSKYDKTISEWRLTSEANYKEKSKKPNKNGEYTFQKSKNEQLSNPVNLSSPTQLAILLYDILKIKSPSTKSPRGTGEDILNKIDLPICKLILERRGLLKLINTYIDKLPECISEKDGRLHAHFNQYGADTGRFSSSDPNLQNIPSHNNEIRMMFVAKKGYTLVGGDYSQQEPRLLSHYSGDEHMIIAYKEGKDLYASIASKVYHNNYEDNLEFNPITKKIQPDGKHRRTSVKSLLLGLLYGMGSASIARSIGCDIQEAEEIKHGFFKEFPKVEKWINKTMVDAHTNGYVEDVWGRRRRLPDLFLQKYIIESKNVLSDFNPLLHTSGKRLDVNEQLIQEYINKLNNCKYKKDVDALKQEIINNGFKVTDNSGYISQAERQCVNARVQGGAASMSKRAMINVHNNQELKELGFKLLIAVHDELIGECPIENVERVKELLSQTMINSALPEVTVPMKCDCDDFKAWYEDVYSSEIKKEYNELNKDNDNAFELLCHNHPECLEEQLKEWIK